MLCGFPAHVYLNELRNDDYRRIFDAAPGLELLDWVVTRREGERFLTPEIEAELSPRFSRDDLLTREVIAVGRRRG